MENKKEADMISAFVLPERSWMFHPYMNLSFGTLKITSPPDDVTCES